MSQHFIRMGMSGAVCKRDGVRARPQAKPRRAYLLKVIIFFFNTVRYVLRGRRMRPLAEPGCGLGSLMRLNEIIINCQFFLGFQMFGSRDIRNCLA